jgi:hypothetical protein
MVSVALTIVIFLPLLGAMLALAAGGRGDRPDRDPAVRAIALAA